jgi:hypothetical protein
MIFGNFEDDINQFLLENKGRSGASKASTIALSKAGAISKGPLNQGRMYTFRYFTPDEFFYDTYPIVIGLGAVSPKSLNQLGINLHYIPYDARIPLITDIVKSFSGFMDSQLKLIGKPDKQKNIKGFTYDAVINSLGKKYNLKYAIRQYRMDRMKNPRVLGYEDWYLGVVNDDNFFFGGNINQAQALYYKNI